MINDNKIKTDQKAARLRILGRPVDALNALEAAEEILYAWERAEFFHVVTANAEMIYRSTKDHDLAKVIEEADLVTADGIGVVLASRLLGQPVPERVAGYDLMLAALKMASEGGRRVFFFGARPEVLEGALVATASRFPGVEIAGHRNGYFSPEAEEEIAAEIASAKPDLLLVALGVPKQELWVSRFRGKLPPCAVIGVGGSFDVLSGKIKRAPTWIQRLGLEWLYRILREPSRWKRALDLPLFLISVLIEALKKRLS